MSGGYSKSRSDQTWPQKFKNFVEDISETALDDTQIENGNKKLCFPAKADRPKFFYRLEKTGVSLQDHC